MRSLLLVATLIAACDGGTDGNGGSAEGGDPPVRRTVDVVTAGGVGETCATSADCTQGPGLHCPGPADPSGLGFCTELCDHLADSGECGPGALCAYVGAGGRCVPAQTVGDLAQPAPTSGDCSAGRVNALGVGQPCVIGFDCTGTGAKLCEAGQREGGFDFCSMDCVYADPKPDPDECGPDATCVYAGQGVGRCVPNACADGLAQPEPAIPDVAIPCEREAAANESGVGHPCTAHSDCSQFTIAYSCPQAIDDGLPNWCSHLCDFEDHASCGEGAFCYWRPGREGGMVGSCAPESCRVSN